MFIVGVDLGQSVDYTAISIVEQITPHDSSAEQVPGACYLLRYLYRPPLRTTYPGIVAEVLSLLDQAPLSRTDTPLVVDRTGVGAAVVDMFTSAGVRPRAVTITGGDSVNDADRWNLRVPKRDLAGTLVALFQTERLKIAAGLELAPVLATELLNFKVKVNVSSGHDSYEAWREGIHDDWVLSVAMACWYGESVGFPAHVWLAWAPTTERKTDMLKTTPRTGTALAAHRARAQAERDRAEAALEAIAARQAAHLAEAEAEGAQRRAEQEAARARMAELAAKLDAMEADERRLKEQIESQERARQQQLRARLDELEAWKPPQPRMSLEEQAALRWQLDREVAEDDGRRAREEEQRQREELDREWRRRQARTLAALRAQRDRRQQE